MGYCEALFLPMKSYLIPHLKILSYLMLIIVLIVLSISFLQNIMNLLLDVLDSFKKFGFLTNLGQIMGGILQGSCNGKSYVNGGQWLEPQAHLKRVVANRVVEGSSVAMLNIRKDLILCAWMFRFLYYHDMSNHLVDYLYFSISMWVEGSLFGQLVVHHRPQVGLENA
jgi:hypothetical protein